MNTYTLILSSFSEAPPNQIDKHIRDQLKNLSTQESVKSDEILNVIDQCVRYSAASDFAVSALNVLWEQMLKAEGTTVEQAIKNAEIRRYQMAADDKI